MKITEHQQRFLETLKNYGINYSVGHSFLGIFDIEPNEIELYINDKDAFTARRLGVSKETFVEWQVFASTLQCLGKTKTGNRCNSKADKGFRVEASNFGLSNENCFCPIHKSQTRNS